MRWELPQFTRCCMCLPLRPGLIAWGYIRLVIGIIILVGASKGFFWNLEKIKTESGYEISIVICGFFVMLAGTDIVLNVVFIIAGHTKDLKMLKFYYIYSFILWILMIIILIALTAYVTFIVTKRNERDFLTLLVILCDLITFLADILIQAYVLLLVRSVLIKLTNNCEFRFVNNAAESACKMKCEQDYNADDDYAYVDYVDEDYKANNNTNGYRANVNDADDGYKVNEDTADLGDKGRLYKHGTNSFKNTY